MTLTNYDQFGIQVQFHDKLYIPETVQFNSFSMRLVQTNWISVYSALDMDKCLYFA